MVTAEEEFVIQRLIDDVGVRNNANVYFARLNSYEKNVDAIRASNTPKSIIQSINKIRRMILRVYKSGTLKPQFLTVVNLRSIVEQMSQTESIERISATPRKEIVRKEKKDYTAVEKMRRRRAQILNRLTCVKSTEFDDLFGPYDRSFLLAEDECYPCHVPHRSVWLCDGTILDDI